jgi:hypothetical protein
MNYQEDVESDIFQQEHHKTEKVQQEHHTCEFMAGISSCKLYVYQPFFHFTYYKCNLNQLTSELCIIFVMFIEKKIFI